MFIYLYKLLKRTRIIDNYIVILLLYYTIDNKIIYKRSLDNKIKIIIYAFLNHYSTCSLSMQLLEYITITS